VKFKLEVCTALLVFFLLKSIELIWGN
jgi:hypothetical protein